MPDLAYYKSRWVAIGEDDSIAAVGETLEETRQFGIQTHPRSRLTFAFVSPHPPHILLPAWPLETIRRIQFDAQTWLAGGPVRDLLLKRTPHDWDFVTTGSGLRLAREAADALKGGFYVLDAERGTGRAVVTPPRGADPITLDFAELRGSDLEADLWKRDFTINAMALSLDGELIDPTGGQQDLENRTLRMTTPAAFEEDPARLLRAVRLATQFDFTIEPNTAASLHTQSARIETIAVERIRQELTKLLAHPRATLGLAQLARFELLPYVLPAFPDTGNDAGSQSRGALETAMAGLGALHQMDALLRGDAPFHPSRRSERRREFSPLWAWEALNATFAEHQPALLGYLTQHISAELTRSDLLKWSALFCATDSSMAGNFSASQRAESQLQTLRFSGNSIAFAVATVRHLPNFAELAARSEAAPADRDIYRYYRNAGDAGVAVAILGLAQLLVNRGCEITRGEWNRSLATSALLLEAYFQRHAVVVAPPPLLTGRDVMHIGLAQGPLIGRVLEALREAQAAGEVTDREEATAFVEHFIEIQPHTGELGDTAYDAST